MLASGPPLACSTQASVSPQMLAVNVMARLMPPEMIGISMASVSRPSSGNWNATESKVASVRKRGDSRLKTAMTATSASSEADVLGAELRGEAPRQPARWRVQIGGAGRRSCPPSAAACAASICPSGALESVIATRMIAPTIILKA